MGWGMFAGMEAAGWGGRGGGRGTLAGCTSARGAAVSSEQENVPLLPIPLFTCVYTHAHMGCWTQRAARRVGSGPDVSRRALDCLQLSAPGPVCLTVVRELTGPGNALAVIESVTSALLGPVPVWVGGSAWTPPHGSLQSCGDPQSPSPSSVSGPGTDSLDTQPLGTRGHKPPVAGL